MVKWKKKLKIARGSIRIHKNIENDETTYFKQINIDLAVVFSKILNGFFVFSITE